MAILNTGLLELLEEKELFIVCKNSDLNLFLEPMKKAPRMYKMYTKNLANLDKKQKMVQTFLPRCAVDLYQRGDQQYIVAFEKAALKIKNSFVNDCADFDISVSDIKDYNIEQLVELHQKLENKKAKEIPVDLFLVYLKLVEVKYDEKKSNELFDIIKDINDKKNTEIERQKEIKTALKNQEKTLNAQFEQEKERYHKEKRRLSKENGELKKQLESLKEELDAYKKREEDEYQNLIEKWNKDIQKEIEKKRKDNEQELSRTYKDELKKINEKIQAERKKQEEILMSGINEIKERGRIEEESLKKAIENLEKEKDTLQNNVDSVREEMANIDRELEEKRKTEEKYFSNIDTRVYERKLDEVFIKRLNSMLPENNQSNVYSNGETVGDYLVSEGSFLEEEIERCDSASSIDELMVDLTDNIDIYFENASDISASIISVLEAKKAIIMEQSVAYKIGLCISAIINSSKPIHISIHDSLSVNMQNLIDLIKSKPNNIIIIDGVLDKFDETMFITICNECQDKYLIFSLSSLNHVGLYTKAIYSYAVLMDIEEYLKYRSDEKVLVSNNNIQDIYEYKNENKKRLCYDKVFRNLVAKKIVGKRTSLDYAEMISVYSELNGNDVIGEVMKKSILFCCDFTDIQDADKLLSRSGLN